MEEGHCKIKALRKTLKELVEKRKNKKLEKFEKVIRVERDDKVSRIQREDGYIIHREEGEIKSLIINYFWFLAD